MIVHKNKFFARISERFNIVQLEFLMIEKSFLLNYWIYVYTFSLMLKGYSKIRFKHAFEGIY